MQNYDVTDLIDSALVGGHVLAKDLADMVDVEILKRAEDALQRSEGKGRQLPGSFRIKERGYGHQRRIPMDHTFRKSKLIRDGNLS